jgi:hypothetical protein
MFLVINGCSSKGTSYKRAPARDIWKEFYKNYPNGDTRVTKEMLFAVCKQVDDKFGTIFLPPIR